MPPPENEPEILIPAEATINDLTLLETPLESFVQNIHFETASSLLEYFNKHPTSDNCWAFRGHANADWRLAPLIERLKKTYSNSFRSDAEEYVGRAFKRGAHHFVRDLPKKNDALEWLALMRHHGAPTRLLDWTRSPYVAAFFATAEAKEDEVSAIWAVDIQAIKAEAVLMLTKAGAIVPSPETNFSFSDRKVFNAVFVRETCPTIVAPVQPFRTNERVTSQQGLFLCPNSLRFGFEFGLKQVLRSDQVRTEKWLREDFQEEGGLEPDRLLKIHIAPQARRDVLKELHRMNINYATLFPGLDGFARSLNTVITISKEIIFGEEFDFPI